MDKGTSKLNFLDCNVGLDAEINNHECLCVGWYTGTEICASDSAVFNYSIWMAETQR